MTGCSDDDPATPSSQTSNLSFGVSDEWLNGTRAIVDDADDLKSASFCVLGKYSSGSTYNASNLTTVFGGGTNAWDMVSWDSNLGTSGEWTYAPAQKWVANSTFRFCAYWPYSSSVRLSGDLANTVTLTGFSVNSNPTKQEDLLISDIPQVVVTSPLSAPGVDFNFRHALCRVNFKIKKHTDARDEDKFTVTKVELSGMYASGTLTSTYSNNKWTDEWTGSTDLLNFNQSVSSTAGVVPDDKVSTTAKIWTNDLMCIPQVPSTISIIVYFDVVNNGETKHASAVMALPAISTPAPPAWEAGKVYSYTVAINESHDIIFAEPDIEPWVESQAGGTIIIK